MMHYTEDELHLLAGALQFAHLNRGEFYRYLNEQGHEDSTHFMESHDHNVTRRKLNSHVNDFGVDKEGISIERIILEYVQMHIGGEVIRPSESHTSLVLKLHDDAVSLTFVCLDEDMKNISHWIKWKDEDMNDYCEDYDIGYYISHHDTIRKEIRSRTRKLRG